ncbi:hypothetical protein SESBI_22422 [Sesbania bispinosa]|nr:hypothetical protein SESBI_22422 [Sesbania bispinosa]
MDKSIVVHCRFRPTMNLKDLVKLNNSLSDLLKERISMTPFDWLLKLSDNKSYQISNTLLTELMKSDSVAFKVDNKSVRFVINEMALILGYSIQGATVDILGRDSSSGNSPLKSVSDFPCLLNWGIVYMKDSGVKCILGSEVFDKLVSFSHEKEHDVVKHANELEDVGHNGDGIVSPLADFSTPSQQ